MNKASTQILALIVLGILLTGCKTTTQEYADVKYGDRVEVSSYRDVDTSGSSFMRGGSYDESEQYLILNLSGTNYNYCDVPEYVVDGLESASSHGSYYNSNIKGQYDC